MKVFFCLRKKVKFTFQLSSLNEADGSLTSAFPKPWFAYEMIESIATPLGRKLVHGMVASGSILLGFL